MKAIILAAGHGKRLEDVTKGTIPKCLLAFGEQTLLERQVGVLRSLGIDEIVVVVGKGKCWNEYTMSQVRKIADNVVINPKSEQTHSPYSLYLGLCSLAGKDSIIVCDGDLVFEEAVLKLLLGDKRENIIVTRAMESLRISETGSKIVANEQGRVIACGREILSNRLNCGLFKIGEGTFELLKRIMSDERSWTREMECVLDELCNESTLYNIHTNSKISDVPPEVYKESVFWEQIPRMIEISESGVCKRATTGRQKLIDEIKWLQSLPPDFKGHFPQILEYDLSVPYYKMRYYPYHNLKDLIFSQGISTKKTCNLIESILDFMFSTLYKTNCTSPPPGYIRYCYLERIKLRLQEAKAKSDLLCKIITAPTLCINGRESRNTPTLLDKIGKDMEFLGTLEPPFISMVHGDLKLDNILVDPLSNDFILIDPRGRSPMGLIVDDPIRDIAKLFTSCHGFYDLFKEHMVNLTVDTDKTPISINIEFPHSKVFDYFSEITNRVLDTLPQYSQIAEDANWRKRLFFADTMVLIAYAPFYLTSSVLEPRVAKDERFTIGLYARGLRLLNEFLGRYPLSDEQNFYNIININTVRDYEIAKETFGG